MFLNATFKIFSEFLSLGPRIEPLHDAKFPVEMLLGWDSGWLSTLASTPSQDRTEKRSLGQADSNAEGAL